MEMSQKKRKKEKEKGGRRVSGIFAKRREEKISGKGGLGI